MHYIALQILFGFVQPCAIKELKTQWWVNRPRPKQLKACIHVVQEPCITPGTLTTPMRSSLQQTLTSVSVERVAVQE